jgi:hypothetical protein
VIPVNLAAVGGVWFSRSPGNAMQDADTSSTGTYAGTDLALEERIADSSSLAFRVPDDRNPG